MSALLVVALTSAVAANLADDFEGGTLLVSEMPPGQWNDLTVKSNTTVGRSAAAAHRGGSGLRVTDNRSSAVHDLEGFVGREFPPGIGDFYFRAWVRIVASAAPSGHFIEFANIMASSGPNAMCTAGVSLAGALVSPWGAIPGSNAFTLPPLPSTAPVTFTLDARVTGATTAQARAWLQTQVGERLTLPSEQSVEVAPTQLDSGCGCDALSFGRVAPLALLALIAGARRSRRA